jgi:hypothetical protein
MRMAKATEEDINALRQFLLALEEIFEERHNRFDEAEDVIRRFPIGWRRVVEGYETLLQNACDPTLNYLEWKPHLKAILERQGSLFIDPTKPFNPNTTLGELVENAESWNAGLAKAVFSSGAGKAIAAVIVLRGEGIERYLQAIEQVEHQFEKEGDRNG